LSEASNLRFAMEAREAIRIGCERRQQDLQRNVAIELRIPRPIYLAHAAGANRGNDFVRPESDAGTERHVQ